MVNKIYFLKIIILYTDEECANFTSATVETYEYITCESIENTYTGIGENLKPFMYLLTTISVEFGTLKFLNSKPVLFIMKIYLTQCLVHPIAQVLPTKR